MCGLRPESNSILTQAWLSSKESKTRLSQPTHLAGSADSRGLSQQLRLHLSYICVSKYLPMTGGSQGKEQQWCAKMVVANQTLVTKIQTITRMQQSTVFDQISSQNKHITIRESSILTGQTPFKLGLKSLVVAKHWMLVRCVAHVHVI